MCLPEQYAAGTAATIHNSHSTEVLRGEVDIPTSVYAQFAQKKTHQRFTSTRQHSRVLVLSLHVQLCLRCSPLATGLPATLVQRTACATCWPHYSVVLCHFNGTWHTNKLYGGSFHHRNNATAQHNIIFIQLAAPHALTRSSLHAC